MRSAAIFALVVGIYWALSEVLSLVMDHLAHAREIHKNYLIIALFVILMAAMILVWYGPPVGRA